MLINVEEDLSKFVIISCGFVMGGREQIYSNQSINSISEGLSSILNLKQFK